MEKTEKTAPEATDTEKKVPLPKRVWNNFRSNGPAVAVGAATAALVGLGLAVKTAITEKIEEGFDYGDGESPEA